MTWYHQSWVWDFRRDYSFACRSFHRIAKSSSSLNDGTCVNGVTKWNFPEACHAVVHRGRPVEQHIRAEADSDNRVVMGMETGIAAEVELFHTSVDVARDLYHTSGLCYTAREELSRIASEESSHRTVEVWFHSTAQEPLPVHKTRDAGCLEGQTGCIVDSLAASGEAGHHTGTGRKRSVGEVVDGLGCKPW